MHSLCQAALERLNLIFATRVYILVMRFAPQIDLQVPLMMMGQRAHVTICNHLGLPGYSNIDMVTWKRDLADRWDSHSDHVRIAVIGKYTNLSDAYLSVIKALQHACLAVRRKLELVWVEAGDIEPEVRSVSCQYVLELWLELDWIPIAYE
jgi:CTP synthase